jgi:hypothetical protein
VPRLTSDQLQALTAICDRLVPADGTGPGALELGAAGYIERALEAAFAALVPLYERGLQTLDERARARHASGFAGLDGAAQDSLLRELESAPIGSDGQAFFETVRNHTIEGMFGDPSWGGNRGFGGWKLIGYRRPQLVWSAADQEIASVVADRQRPDRIEDRR